MARRMSRRLGLLLVVAALPLVLWGVLPMLSGAESPGQLQNQIDSAREKIDAHRGRERVLTSDISAATSKINALQGDITQLQTKQVRLEADLAAKREELAAIQEDLRRERLRLARLRERLAEARVLLANRLVEIYKSDAPDVVTVVLESDGFADLLERTEFLQRISDQDREITDRVRGLRDKAQDQAVELADLEQREQLAAERILHERDQIASAQGQLVASRDQLASARADKRGALAQVRDSRVALEGDLAALEKEQARVQAALQGAGQTFDGPIRHGSGALIWPVNGPVVSPFGMRWGRLHAGIDIAVPSGTAIHAADSGRVVLMGWVGGYGNYTCIQHTASMSTCYAHQSSFATSNGASVSQGQVIGYSDCTGHCFGPHLHFEVRINGSPVDPLGYL
jgi:peptidoglycan DL-endopeptidase CwlO